MKTLIVPSVATLLALGLLIAAPLRAASIDELAASLRVEVEKSLAEGKTGKSGSSSSGTYEVERLMSQLTAALARDNFEQAEQTLAQLAVARLSLDAKERVNQLQRELPKAAEERQKAFLAQVGAAIDKAGKTCLSAKAESELDPILAELGALKKQRSETSSSEPRQRLNTRIEGAIRFVNRWQDYLVQKSRGYEASARTILRELTDPTSSQFYPLLPRAEIVARLGAEQDTTADDVLRAIKSLDDIPKAIIELNRIARENSSRFSSSYDPGSPINELNQIVRAHAAFKAGNYGSALVSASQWDTTSGSRSPEGLRLKTLLLFEVLPRYVELPDNPQPKAGENPSEYLLRLAGEGVARNDWQRVARALDAYRVTAFGYRSPPAWVSADVEACQQFVAGQNLEKAGRFVPAIAAYQRALKSTGKYNPQKAATDRLAALEKEQPAAYAQASKLPELREIIEMLRALVPQQSGMPALRMPESDP